MSRRHLLAAAVAVCGLLTPPVHAGLGLDAAVERARAAAPALHAAQQALAAAQVLRTAAGTRPDPTLSAGIDNLPIAGPDRWRTARDAATMQRLGWMQEMPSRARLAARMQMADARIGRERTMAALAALAVRREVSLAWVAAWHAEQRVALLAELERENALLQRTVPARVAAGTAAPPEGPAARLEALALEDRRDDLARERARARADLRRYVGAAADEPLDGPPVLAVPAPQALRERLPKHAELAPLAAQRPLAAAELADADAEGRGDWSWEVVYSRRPRYDDMVSLQLRFELPWQRDRRQQPAIDARRHEAARVEAELADAERRLAAELDAMLAELEAVDRQLVRVEGPGLALARERAELALAAWSAGRTDLAAVIAARAQVVEQRLRASELAARRDALRVRLTTSFVDIPTE